MRRYTYIWKKQQHIVFSVICSFRHLWGVLEVFPEDKGKLLYVGKHNNMATTIAPTTKILAGGLVSSVPLEKFIQKLHFILTA